MQLCEMPLPAPSMTSSLLLSLAPGLHVLSPDIRRRGGWLWLQKEENEKFLLTVMLVAGRRQLLPGADSGLICSREMFHASHHGIALAALLRILH